MVDTTTGTILSLVASEPATYDSAGFGALTFVAAGEVENLGEFGGSAQIITFTPLATGIVKKYKGSIDYGQATATLGKDVTDAGQILMKAGFDGTDRNTVHSFKVENSGGEIAYFTGLIGSYTFATGDANQVQKTNVNIELNNKVIEA